MNQITLTSAQLASLQDQASDVHAKLEHVKEILHDGAVAANTTMLDYVKSIVITAVNGTVVEIGGDVIHHSEIITMLLEYCSNAQTKLADSMKQWELVLQTEEAI